MDCQLQACSWVVQKQSELGQQGLTKFLRSANAKLKISAKKTWDAEVKHVGTTKFKQKGKLKQKDEILAPSVEQVLVERSQLSRIRHFSGIVEVLT